MHNTNCILLKSVGILLFLHSFILQAQYDNYWLISNQQGMEFLADGTVSSETLPGLLSVSNSGINTANGNRFYSDNGKIYNKGWNLIYTLPVDPSLIPLAPDIDQGNLFASIFLNTPDTNIYYFVTKRSAYSALYSQVFGNFGVIYIYIYKLDTRLNGNQGGVFGIDTLAFLTDTFSDSRLNAVRHSNGKDWWISCSGSNSNIYHTFLYSDKLIQRDTQKIGLQMALSDITRSNICFSQTGNKVAMYKPVGGPIRYPPDWVLELLDFDRCTGKMSNLKSLDLRAQIPRTDNLSGGRSTCAFSPSGENLFITIGAHLFEYNLKTASYYKIWDTIPTANFTQYSIKLAPNGKLYIGYQSLDTNAAFIGVVHQPDSFGPSCGFVQHGYYPVNNVVGFFPNTTNYNLGAVPLAENKRVYKDTICEGDPYERSIDSFAHTRYSWYDSQGTLLNNTRHIRLQPRADAVYSIHLQDSTVSCSDRWDTLYLYVKPLPCVPDTPDTLLKIALPTAFTPNGDGQNETFYPIGNKAFAVQKFSIYNRWGQLLHDAPKAWDGKYKNEPQPEDTYWYVVEIEGVLRKGVVMLMR